MLDAQDIRSVLSWSARHLGSAAGRAAIVEISEEIRPEWVERSGTGANQVGCQAFMSVTADSIQRVEGSESTEFCCLGKVSTNRLEIRKSVVH